MKKKKSRLCLVVADGFDLKRDLVSRFVCVEVTATSTRPASTEVPSVTLRYRHTK
jgi:hypothetical protein